SLRVYYTEKGPLENLKQMAKILKDLLPLNMSFQTLTPGVLENIKRKNLPLPKVREMVRFAKAHQIAVSTELISGLPGESYQSFREVVAKVIDLDFDSIYIGPLYLIKGSELYPETVREHNGFKTMYSLIGKDVTVVEAERVFEADEVVVESKAMSREDFWKLHRLRFFIFLIYGAAFLKEIVMHCKNYGITALDIFDEVFFSSNGYPFLEDITSTYMTSVQSKYHNSVGDLGSAIDQSMEEQGNVDRFSINRQLFQNLGRALSTEGKPFFGSEICRAASTIHGQTDHLESRDKFHDALAALKDIAEEIIISPLEESEPIVIRESRYDLVEWASDGYRRPLSEYKLVHKKPFALCMRNAEEHRDLLHRARDWEEQEKYVFYFTTMVSSNMRRIIRYP
ncbi:MAG: hypothetical protein JRG79_10770, partial [Deltaproteobacteria bacterium]|nr:hypothetical protein [Deltaproteobacteria bacterium]